MVPEEWKRAKRLLLTVTAADQGAHDLASPQVTEGLGDRAEQRNVLTPKKLPSAAARLPRVPWTPTHFAPLLSGLTLFHLLPSAAETHPQATHTAAPSFSLPCLTESTGTSLFLTSISNNRSHGVHRPSPAASGTSSVEKDSETFPGSSGSTAVHPFRLKMLSDAISFWP